MIHKRAAVAIGGSEVRKVHPSGADGPMADLDAILRPSANAMFDDLVWWGRTLRAARVA